MKHKVTRAALGAVYPIVCAGWQNEIRDILNTDKFASEFEVEDSLIRKAFKAADSRQKAWLQNTFPDFEKNLEVGKWYKQQQIGSSKFWLFNFQGEHQALNYGWNVDGDWSNGMGNPGNEDALPATDEEVLEAFRSEAKRRGFVKGVKFDSAMGSGITIVTDELLSVEADSDVFIDGMCIFYEGKWATIIEPEKVKDGIGSSEFESGLAKLMKVAEESNWDHEKIRFTIVGPSGDPRCLSFKELGAVQKVLGTTEDTDITFIRTYKPKEPQYRPFTYEEAVDQLLGKVIKHKRYKKARVAVYVNETHVDGRLYSDILKDYSFLDGSPVGILITENS